jgi:hypothetical protein
VKDWAPRDRTTSDRPNQARIPHRASTTGHAPGRVLQSQSQESDEARTRGLRQSGRSVMGGQRDTTSTSFQPLFSKQSNPSYRPSVSTHPRRRAQAVKEAHLQTEPLPPCPSERGGQEGSARNWARPSRGTRSPPTTPRIHTPHLSEPSYHHYPTSRLKEKRSFAFIPLNPMKSRGKRPHSVTPFYSLDSWEMRQDATTWRG